MIDRDQLTRLKNTIEQAALAGYDAITTYGVDAQVTMIREEMAELELALARLERGRAEAADVVEEAADVIITALQVGIIHCNARRGDFHAHDLIDAIADKTARLNLRLLEAKKRGKL